MITDPSWLYSTIAQSSAAIVAIIGGFITASVLNLLSEKRNLKHQLADKETRLRKIEEKLKERYEWWEAEYLDKRDKLFLEADISDLERRIEKFIYPPNLGWGILVLGYLAVFSIFLPVLVISKEAFSPWLKWLTTVTFWLGITGVFAYIVFQIRTLRRK